MILVIDTSVAVKWFVEESDRELSRQILKSKAELAAPDFLVAEVANVLWRRQRRGDIEAAQLDDALVELPRFFYRLVPAADLVSDALSIARIIGHSIYDCMFLALAAQLPEASLVTADDRFISKASSTQYSPLVRPLSGFAQPQDQ